MLSFVAVVVIETHLKTMILACDHHTATAMLPHAWGFFTLT